MAKRTSGQKTAIPKKIKFLDDGEADIPLENPEKESTPEETSESEPDSESDSDSDDAPEEESMSSGKAQVEKQQQEKARLDKERKQKEKEQRKERDAIFQKQQKEKRERLKQLTNSKELPDYLPEELIESEEEDFKSLPQGKHVRSEELEKEYEQMKKKLKAEKLKKLKEQRSQAIKKGPVHVQVSRFETNKNSAPKADPRILETKESWLHRKSLRRK